MTTTTTTSGGIIMEYGSTPYVGMVRKKMAAPYNAYKIIRSEYHDISSVFISNKTASVARNFH